MDPEESAAEPPPDDGGSGKKARAGRDLPAALLVGFSLFSLVIVCMIFWPLGVALILAVLAVFGCIEIHNALALQGARSAVIPVAVFAAPIVVSGYFLDYLPWAITAVAMFTAMLWRMPAGAEGYVRDIAASALIICYVPLLASFIGPVLAMPNGAAKLAAIFLCVCGSDTGGYALGATLGKHQLAPKISPKKTWEGLVGSVLLASLVGGLIAHFALGMAWWIGVVLALVVTFFSTVGDLVESLIKRDIGIKDMSSFLPGHGGVMDRLDSILVGIPAGWLFFTLTGL